MEEMQESSRIAAQGARKGKKPPKGVSSLPLERQQISEG